MDTKRATRRAPTERTPCGAPSKCAPDRPPPIAGGLWPGLIAVGPGFFVHGLGTYQAGDRRAARALVLAELGGLAGLILGGVLVGPTGASRRTVTSGTALIVLGLGAFGASHMADIYGSFTGLSSSGRARRVLPPLSVELGYQYVYDPQFQYRSFARGGVTGWFGDWRVRGGGLIALDDDNQRPELALAWRLLGPTAAERARDGSWLELRSDVMWHRYGTDGFNVLTTTLSAAGRVDLGRLGPTLHGAFAQLGVGTGFEFYGYDQPGLGFATDTGEFLIADFGFGLYLGDEGQGEVVFVYDHRRDGLASGLGTTGLSGGIPGHFGVYGQWAFTEQWGVGWRAEVGSAYIGGLHVIWTPLARGAR